MYSRSRRGGGWRLCHDSHVLRVGQATSAKPSRVASQVMDLRWPARGLVGMFDQMHQLNFLMNAILRLLI
jgi:hypothetical protein